ncbi:hypothetical protein SO802_006141 [Lithocarpus litseifolius]|uniref:Uncharacterized protein n=1 Tax=Lithocarpus litseifolius TaxID=425828 RepID=A0AAW2DN73_9ROSI
MFNASAPWLKAESDEAPLGLFKPPMATNPSRTLPTEAEMPTLPKHPHSGSTAGRNSRHNTLPTLWQSSTPPVHQPHSNDLGFTESTTTESVSSTVELFSTQVASNTSEPIHLESVASANPFSIPKSKASRNLFMLTPVQVKIGPTLDSHFNGPHIPIVSPPQTISLSQAQPQNILSPSPSQNHLDAQIPHLLQCPSATKFPSSHEPTNPIIPSIPITTYATQDQITPNPLKRTPRQLTTSLAKRLR